jgi:hypothetical protein
MEQRTSRHLGCHRWQRNRTPRASVHQSQRSHGRQLGSFMIFSRSRS